MKTVCGRAARAARLTAEAQNLERSGPYMSVPFRLLSTQARRDGGEMEARRKRDGGELEARRRRRRDSKRRRGGGEMADGGERRGRDADGGEMEASWRRDGGEMEAATRVAATSGESGEAGYSP